MTTNQNNLAKQLISAVAHTANYLKQATRRLHSLEDNVTGIEDQLSDIQDCLSTYLQTITYGTPEYWQQQRIEIFKVALAHTITLDAKHEAILLAEKYADDALGILQTQQNTLESAITDSQLTWYDQYRILMANVQDPDVFEYSSGLLV